MLYLLFSLFVSQPFLVSASVTLKERMTIEEGNKGNKSISGSKVEAEMPTFLLSIYNELGVESESKFLKIFQAESKLRKFLLIIIVCYNNFLLKQRAFCCLLK